MICTTIQNKTYDEIQNILPSCEMAEIRLDRCPLSDDEISELFMSDVPIVATCRIADTLAANPSMSASAAARLCESRLLLAIEAGARYVDVEIEAPKQMAGRIRKQAIESGTMFIRSYHDFEGTGSTALLKEMVEKCVYHGAQIVKIVTSASSQEDVQRVMSLYDLCGRDRFIVAGRSVTLEANSLIAFCMGEEGRQSRIESLRRGAPYGYACLSREEEAAPGQWTAREMAREVYGDWKFMGEGAPLLEMPASKSFAQRAIIAAALAEGTSHLRNYSPCSDSEAALSVAREMGAEVSVDGREITIKGIAAKTGSVDVSELNVCESGLLTRLMIPLTAQIASRDVTIRGEGTLLTRPLKGVEKILASFGVQVHGLEDGEQCKVPLKVSGQLSPAKAEVSGKDGSQLISGLLMALPLADKFSSIVVNDPKSIPYMFITVDVLKQFGVKVSNEMSGGRDFLESDGDWSLCTQMTFKIRGNQAYKAADIDLEGDWSAAANFLVAGAVFGKVALSGLDTTSLQADLSIMDILMDAGASLSQNDGDKGVINVQRSPLSAFNVDATNCPDLFPIVSVLAAFCEGTSRIEGVSRLAHKESDRGAAIVQMMEGLGVPTRIEGDALLIEGETLSRRILCGHLLKGGKFTSHHDHRMAMALDVASLGTSSPVEIDDRQCQAKSFPGFSEMFDRMLGL